MSIYRVTGEDVGLLAVLLGRVPAAGDYGVDFAGRMHEWGAGGGGWSKVLPPHVRPHVKPWVRPHVRPPQAGTELEAG